MLPWAGVPIALHQVRLLLDRGYDEVWVRAEAPELLAALPRHPLVRLGPPPPGAASHDCFHPVGAPGVDLRRPETVPPQGWGVVRQAAPGLVVFSEPLCVCPRWDTDYVHAYLIVGRDRGLLIDSGSGLMDIGTRARALCPDLEIIHTHGDWDHVGGSGVFGQAYAFGRPQRVPAATLRRQLARPSAAPWRPTEPDGWPLPPPRSVAPPAQFDLGDRRLSVLRAPGHTADGLALYDSDSGDLFAGDALYAGLLYARDVHRFQETARRLRGLPGLRRIWGGHGPVPVSERDVDEYGQLVK